MRVIVLGELHGRAGKACRHIIVNHQAGDVMRRLVGVAAEFADIRASDPLPEKGDVKGQNENNGGDQRRPVF